MTTAALEPLISYDAGDRMDRYWRASDAWRTEFSRWLQRHGISPSRVARVDVYLLDAPFAVVRQLALNAEGKIYADPATGEIAWREPARVLLDSLPPDDGLAPATA